jgi:hypothetical protein
VLLCWRWFIIAEIDEVANFVFIVTMPAGVI